MLQVTFVIGQTQPSPSIMNNSARSLEPEKNLEQKKNAELETSYVVQLRNILFS